MKRHLIALVALTIGAIATHATPARAAAGDTTFVSRASGAGGAAADADSHGAAISADGRYVAFTSGADDLSDQDNDAYSNVYVRDVQSGTTTLVSRADGAGGAAANGNSSEPSISGDGRYVAFASVAANLSLEDNDMCPSWWWGDIEPCSNIFIRDLQAGTTKYVSRAAMAANGGSYSPSISLDGLRVAFTSVAENLSATDVNECYTSEGAGYPCANFFVRDLLAGTTTYLAPGSHSGAVILPEGPVISANGAYVAFSTESTEFLPGDNNGYRDVFVADLQTGTFIHVSRADGPDGAQAQFGESADTSISADGRYVAFASAAYNLSDQNIDGFDAHDVYVRDIQAGRTFFVSRANGVTGAAADGTATQPSISPDGRYVAFMSPATNLSMQDSDSCYDPWQGAIRPCHDIFVRDLQANETHYASRASGTSGTAGDAPSTNPAAANGGRVAFESLADTLSMQDNDLYSNVFIREPGTATEPPPNCASAKAIAGSDSWIAQNAPTSNFGKSSSLRVKSKSGANYRTFVRFSLPAIPSGCKVTSAKMRLYATSVKPGRNLAAAAVASPWTETGITWNNRPSVTGVATTIPSTSAPGWVEWTVTTQVINMYSGTNHGFRIRDTNEDASDGFGQNFHSRDSGVVDKLPELVVTFGPA